MAKDFLGKELKVGDEVVFVLLGYREFRRGTVKKLTPKTLIVEQSAASGSYNRETKQFHNQVIKLENSNV